MSSLFSYVVEHDMGFAPHPFGRICSLANCKPQIRMAATVGDYVIGTGSAQDKMAGRLIYWMLIDEVVSFDQYWSDPRFKGRRPVMNGSDRQRYGDNIYYTGDDGVVRQLDSFHSEPDGVTSQGNLKRDTGTTNRVLLGENFAYFGANAPDIPPDIAQIVKKGPGHKRHFSEATKSAAVGWFTGIESRGLQGEPVGWVRKRKKSK
ncbi:MAG: hypothetical protein JJ911_04240 [Rhizobiaceae bacterium]|nr:hypothetical protein [Rhizobiaceae bacterium]